MSRRNQAKRRRAYGRRQHEVRERRSPDAPTEGDVWTRDSWTDWTTADTTQDQQTTDDGSYGSYAR